MFAVFVFMISAFSAVIVAFSGNTITNAQSSSAVTLGGSMSVKQISTGAASACAVVGGNIKCWGANDFGQLGNGNTTTSSNPVTVSKQSGVLTGKTIAKVSVGATHTCALADAQVYCWGGNNHGQLGDHTNTDSSVPVAVAINGSVISKTETVCTGYILTWCTGSKQVTTTKPISSLVDKEIIDVSAGEYFTCALASDGAVSCWGAGENGRLGTNSKSDTNYPQSVYNATGSVFAGKKGVKLAKAAGATMCVIATENTATAVTGSPYCWGYGIDDGTQLPANGVSTVACGKTTPTAKPATTTVTSTKIFESAKPVNVPGATFAAIDGSEYVTGLSSEGRAYYWGMYGYTETAAISNITTCTVNPCTSRVNETISLALTSSQKKAKAANQGGGDKKKNLNSNNSAAQSANNAANGYTTKTQYGSYTSSGGSYYGIAVPRTVYYAGTDSSNNNKPNASCGNQTHYGYTKNATYNWSGKKVATTPPAWSGSQGGFSAVSGNVNDGLFCATNSQVTNCDAHGTEDAYSADGRTGSNYVPVCRQIGFIFTTKQCDTPPTGPQQVVSNGWLAGKSVSSLSTGAKGYTCALASGAVGCWGANSYGQLGNGTKVNKNVPTAVNL